MNVMINNQFAFQWRWRAGAAPSLPLQQRRATAKAAAATAARRTSPAAAAAVTVLQQQTNEPPPSKQQQQTPPLSKKNTAGDGPNDGGPENGDGPPQPPELPPVARRALALLVEFAGVYGTAAVALGWLLGLDAFGNLHWDADDAALGLQLFAPLLAFDALVMLPDWAPRGDQLDAAGRLLLGGGGGGSSSSTSSSSSSSSSDQKQPALPPQPAFSPLLRLQLAFELLQSHNTRNNPAIGLPLAAEAGVAAAAALADEMLYRAVFFTFAARWLTDRAYEAGADDAVALPAWLAGWALGGADPAVDGAVAAVVNSSASSGGGMAWGLVEVPTALAGQLAALGIIAALGAAGFAAKALQDRRAAQRLQIIAQRAAAAAAASGNNGGPDKAAAERIIASVTQQSAVIYLVEGVREISLGLASGLAFVRTGNLGAPLAGSMVLQLLFLLYQRYSLQRQLRRRREALARMQARSAQVKDAIKSALAAREARQAQQQQQQQQQGDSQGPPDAKQPAEGETVAGERGMDEPLTPAARVMLSDLTVSSAGAASAERAADLAAIQAAVADAPAAGQAADGSGGPVAVDGDEGGGDGSDGARAEATARLEALLSDMLRSPEGRRVARAFRDSGGDAAGGGGGDSDGDLDAYIDSLLADPPTRAKLLAELEERLVAMGSKQKNKDE